MENLALPLNLVFSTRAASQEITVPSDATKKTFTIHSYRDTVVNGKVSKSDIIDFTTSITYDPPISSSNAWVFTKKTANDTVSYNLEVDISANSGSSSRTAIITLTQATTGKVITITITQKAVDIPMVDIPMYVEIWGRYDKNSLTTYKDLPYILNYNGQYVTSGTLPASPDEYLLIPVTKVPWSDKGSYTEPTAIFELYLKGSQLVDYSDFYFNISFYDAQGLFYGCNRKYSQAINYKRDIVDPSDWTPSDSFSYGSITVKKGNLSPSDFSGGILVELILGSKINGYIKRVMLRIKIN